MYAVYKSGACSFRRHLEFGLHRVIALICKVQHLIGEEHIFPNCLFRQGSLVALKTERIAYRNTEDIWNHFCRFSRDCRAAEALHGGISRNVIANYHFSKGFVFHCGILRQDKSIFTAQTAFFFNFLNNSCAVLSCDFGHGLFGKPWRYAYDFLQIANFVERCICLVFIWVIVAAQQRCRLQLGFCRSNVFLGYFLEWLIGTAEAALGFFLCFCFKFKCCCRGCRCALLCGS